MLGLKKPAAESPLDKARKEIAEQWKNCLGGIISANTREKIAWARGEARGFMTAVRVFGLVPKAVVDQMDQQMKARSKAAVSAQEIEDQDASEVRAMFVQKERMGKERDFWVEQCRTLQNMLQTVQQQHSAALEQVARQTGTPDDLRALLSSTNAALCEPVVGVEAVRALTASLSPNCQGSYTPMAAPARAKLQDAGRNALPDYAR